MTTAVKTKTAYDILVEASESAEQAVKACTPQAIIVGSPSTPFGNDVDPNQKTWFVEGGVCGFASVVIKPARGNIVAELKKRKIGSAHYGGGYSFSSWQLAPSIRQDQSYERAVAAAKGAVEVLKKYGINAYVDARID